MHFQFKTRLKHLGGISQCKKKKILFQFSDKLLLLVSDIYFLLFTFLLSSLFLSASVLFHVPNAWRMRDSKIYALICK